MTCALSRKQITAATSDENAAAIKAELEGRKAVVEAKLLAADPTLTKMTDVLWAEIESTAYRFDRRREQVAALRAVTARDVCQFYRTYFSDSTTSRRFLAEVSGIYGSSGSHAAKQMPHLARVHRTGKIGKVVALGAQTKSEGWSWGALDEVKHRMLFWGAE